MTPVVLVLLLLSLTCVSSGSAQSDTGDAHDVNEDIARANKNTTTRLVDLDVKMSRRRNAASCTNFWCKWPKWSRYVYVPYVLSTKFSSSDRSIITDAMESFHETTCIRFVPKRWWHYSYLSLVSGDGCWSYVGRQWGRQSVSLMRRGCMFLGTVQHELLHALGFQHEQSRSDRDSFVNILYQNIESGATSNFNKRSTNNLGSGYNYKSVMHYGRFAFSKNGSPTILAKTDPSIALGSSRMTSSDIDRVNKLYNCRV